MTGNPGKVGLVQAHSIAMECLKLRTLSRSASQVSSPKHEEANQASSCFVTGSRLAGISRQT
ncbi:hypothetical protein, partial [Zoogloea sp.]|uniref:hypothetical protein n=1 Tax=Zoogloea sp. TaxID=49181 RepID=UPI00258FF6BC